MTGAQHGFTDVLAPSYEYFNKYDCNIVRFPEPYIETEFTDREEIENIIFMYDNEESRRSLVTERRARAHFKEFVGCYDCEVLAGSDSEFVQNLAAFVQKLGAYMMELMEWEHLVGGQSSCGFLLSRWLHDA